jgi:hypothetical protein
MNLWMLLSSITKQDKFTSILAINHNTWRRRRGGGGGGGGGGGVFFIWVGANNSFQISVQIVINF